MCLCSRWEKCVVKEKMGKKICRVMGWVLAALMGVASAAALFASFSWISVEDSAMLPTLQPGQHVLIRKICLQDVSKGDLVFCKQEFFEAGTAEYRIRRVCRITEQEVELGCDQKLVRKPESEETLKRDAIIGKVIGNYG